MGSGRAGVSRGCPGAVRCSRRMPPDALDAGGGDLAGRWPGPATRTCAARTWRTYKELQIPTSADTPGTNDGRFIGLTEVLAHPTLSHGVVTMFLFRMAAIESALGSALTGFWPGAWNVADTQDEAAPEIAPDSTGDTAEACIRR